MAESKANILDVKQQRVLLLGMGNPLLDKMIETADTNLHKKYSLDVDSAYLVDPLNAQKLLSLFDEIENQKSSVKYVSGGSAQNTLRVFHWILRALSDQHQKSAAYFGAVGEDQNALKLEELARENGVDAHYQRFAQHETGVCAVLILGVHRCLVAKLGAAEKFTMEHLFVAENQQLIAKAENFFVEGYFLTVCLDAILHIAKHAAETNKPFTLSLSAGYICESFREPLNAVLPFVDVLFGNADEARAYAKANDFKEKADLSKIVLEMAAFEKVNKLRSRLVVITCGNEPIRVATEGKLQVFPVHPIEENKIKDTNGAGDGFSGGFLASMSLGRPLEKCIEAGIFAAQEVIQNVGCTFPAVCNYKETKNN